MAAAPDYVRAVPRSQVTERYPWTGEEQRYKRRDLRRGAYLVHLAPALSQRRYHDSKAVFLGMVLRHPNAAPAFI